MECLENAGTQKGALQAPGHWLVWKVKPRTESPQGWPSWAVFMCDFVKELDYVYD